MAKTVAKRRAPRTEPAAEHATLKDENVLVRFDSAGKALVKRAAAIRGLHVSDLTAGNQTFYQRMGFLPVPGTTHKLYLPAATLLEVAR